MSFISRLIPKKIKEEGTFVEHRLHVRRERREAALFLAILIAVLGWLYVFFFSEIFIVQSVEIEGTELLDRGEVSREAYDVIDGMRMWPFRKRNIIFLDANVISHELTDRLFAESVTVDKKYPNILRLKIEERQSSLILLVKNELYEIDRTGTVTREISNEDEINKVLSRIERPADAPKKATPILKIQTTFESVVVGDSYVSEFRSKAWLDTFHELQDLGFGYRNAVIDYATSSKLILNMFEPYDVYFDILEPMEPQINGFYAFIRVKDPNAQIYEYVDARIPGKIFYK